MKIQLLSGTTFVEDLHLLIYRPQGALGQEEVERVVEMLDSLENERHHPFNRYTDLTRLDSFDLSYSFVFRISLHRRSAYKDFPPVKSAFYVTSPAVTELIETHVQLTSQSPLVVKIFRTPEAAAEWLGVSLNYLELPERIAPPISG
jgi:hypothetical protein